MITASKEIFYNVLMGEWKDLTIRLVHISSDIKVNTKIFRLENFIFDDVNACENCHASLSECQDCEGVVEILALVGSLKVNKKRVEDGFVIPLLGDVIFDLREGFLSILTDTDVVVISRVAESNLQDSDTGENIVNEVMPRNEKVSLRLYLLTENKVKRIAVKALQDGRLFHNLAGKKAVVVEITYVRADGTPLYLRSMHLYYAYFDEEGRVDEELTFPRYQYGNMIKCCTKINDKVIEIGQRDKQPELTNKQKDLMKKRLLKDFGTEAWQSTSMRIKSILE